MRRALGFGQCFLGLWLGTFNAFQAKKERKNVLGGPSLAIQCPRESKGQKVQKSIVVKKYLKVKGGQKVPRTSKVGKNYLKVQGCQRLP